MNYTLTSAVKGITAFPQQVEAVERVIKWIEEHATEYNGSATDLLILGASSGGNIGLLAAQNLNKAAGKHKIKAVVALSPPEDLVLMCEQGAIVSFVESAVGATAAEIEASGSAAQKKAEAGSPIHNIDSATHPPTMLGGSTNETIVPVQQQRNMQSALVAAGVEVKRYEANGGHAFGYWESTANGGTTGTEPTTAEQAVSFFKAHS